MAEQGHMKQLTEEEQAMVVELKNAKDPVEAHTAAMKMVNEMGAHVWEEGLPYAWRTMLASEHEEGLFELVAAMEDKPISPNLWETLLDECAPITRGRGVLATRLIEELRVLSLGVEFFPSEVERESFHKWRHLVALERQGTF